MMTAEQQNTRDLLKVDPIQTVENLTGKHHSQNPLLFLEASMILNHVVRTQLKAQSDTYFGMTFNYALDVFKRLGFKEYWSETFIDSEWGEPHEECYKIFVHEEMGLLLDIESHTGGVNTTEIYFNWSPEPGVKSKWLDGCSGGFSWKDDHIVYLDDNLEEVQVKLPAKLKRDWQKETWEQFDERVSKSKRAKMEAIFESKYRNVVIGSRDCREGLAIFLLEAKEKGKFLKKWIEPYLCIALCHYREEHNFLHDGVGVEKLVNVPQFMRENLGI